MPPVIDPQQAAQTAAPTPPPAATAAPASLSPSDVMSDPEFLSHDGDTQRAILTRIDPEYANLDRIAQNSVIAKLQQRGGRPSGRSPANAADPNRGFAAVAASDLGGAITAPITVASDILDSKGAGRAFGKAVHMGKEFVAQPLRELAGVPQPGEDTAAYNKLYPDVDAHGVHHPALIDELTNAAASTLGGNPQAAREAKSRGDESGAFAHMVTVPLTTFGLGHVLSGIKKEVSPTRREGAAMQTISGGAVTGKGPEDAAARIAEQQAVVKQVLQKRGITDADLKKLFPSREGAKQSDLVGDVARGNQLILDVARDAVGFVHAPIDAVMSRYGKQPAGAVPSRIAKSLAAQAVEIGKVNPALADSITELSKKVSAARTFEELNDIKSHANKMLDSVYSPVPGKAIDATAERAYAYKLAADGIRTEMYPELQKLSGSSLDLAKLGRREGDAIALRDGIYKHYLSDVAPAQAGKDAASFLEYTLAGQGAPGHSYYSKHILARGLEKSGVVPSAGSELNSKFRRAAGSIGSGMTPEKVNVHPRSGPPPAPSGQPPVVLGKVSPTGVPHNNNATHGPTPPPPAAPQGGALAPLSMHDAPDIEITPHGIGVRPALYGKGATLNFSMNFNGDPSLLDAMRLGKKLFPNMADKMDPNESSISKHSEFMRGMSQSQFGVDHGKYRVSLHFKDADAANKAYELMGGSEPTSASASASHSINPPLNDSITSHVQLGNGAPGMSGMTRSITANGKPAGHLTYDISGPFMSGDTATIHHVGAPTATYNAMSNTLGPSGISQMVQQLITAHPNVKYIQGIRVGGAQASAGRSVRVPVSKLLPSGKGGQLPPGISLTPYHAGRTARFPNAGKAAVVAGRASGAAQGLTPPPNAPAKDDDENEDQ